MVGITLFVYETITRHTISTIRDSKCSRFKMNVKKGVLTLEYRSTSVKLICASRMGYSHDINSKRSHPKRKVKNI